MRYLFYENILATKLVEWVFNEIDVIKKEKLKESTEKRKKKEEEKRLKREQKRLQIGKAEREKAEKKKAVARPPAPIAVSSDEDILKPPPLIRGRRERIRSHEKPRSRSSSSSSSSSSSTSSSSSSSSSSPTRRRKYSRSRSRSKKISRKNRKKKSRSRSRSTRSRSPAKIQKRVVQKTQKAFAEVAITRTIKRDRRVVDPDASVQRIDLIEEKSPPRRRRKKSIERMEKLKTTPAHMLVMPDTNPFSGKDQHSKGISLIYR